MLVDWERERVGGYKWIETPGLESIHSMAPAPEARGRLLVPRSVYYDLIDLWAQAFRTGKNLFTSINSFARDRIPYV